MADPPPVLTLLVEKGPRKGQSLQHRAGAVLRVGRVVKGNDLAVGDSGASQRHLDLTFLPPPACRWAATDLGSSNGTLLNDAPLVPTIPAPLSDGDRIKIGERTVLAISIAADAGPEPTAARRSTRHAAAAVDKEEEENKPLAVRRGRRKAPAAAAAVVEEDEEQESKAPAVRRSRRNAPAAAVAVVDEEENEAPAAADSPEAVKGKSKVATRRGGRNKAPAVADPPEEEQEEAAVVKPRRGRKKAAELPEAKRGEEEEVLPQPQSQSARLTRAARRAEAMVTGQDKGEGEQTGRGRGRTTRQSSRKAKEAIHVEEEEGEVALLDEQKDTTDKNAREKDDKAEADQIIEEIGVPLVPREDSQRAPNSSADTNKASADRDEEGKGSGMEEGSGIDQELIEKIVPESKLDGVGDSGEDGKREVNEKLINCPHCPGRCSLEDLTLREWFVRIEVYLRAKRHEAAQRAIAQVEEDHRRVAEYIKTLRSA